MPRHLPDIGGYGEPDMAYLQRRLWFAGSMMIAIRRYLDLEHKASTAMERKRLKELRKAMERYLNA